MANTILRMKEIEKGFNGNTVLDKVNFNVKAGEVHALMGGNGAGKSTLMKILTGVYQLDHGTIEIEDSKVNLENTRDAQQAGVSMIFQEFSLIPKLTVAQNIFLHREPRTSLGMIDDKKMVKDSQRILDDMGLSISPKDLVENLSVGYWQMTEIAKALSINTKILIMDEPTSTLTKTETEVLFSLIHKLKQSGITIIYISHRMDEIFQVCDRITVLRNGTNVITTPCSEITMEELIDHIIGGNMVKSFEWVERPKIEDRKPLLEVKNLQSGSHVKNVSFSLHGGEILGLAGLMGSGRSETVRAIFGVDPVSGGEVNVRGERVSFSSPKEAIQKGVGLVPEDRRSQGLVLGHSVRENMILSSLDKLSKNNVLQNQQANKKVEELVKKLNVKTDSTQKKISLLSGGNQQKVVLAKWLLNETEILLLDEPTSGVDIGAKIEIIEIIRELADAGKAILVVSSEMTELLAMSDRVLIMKDGEVTNSIERKDIKGEEDVERAIQGEG
ncbi:sugar ABC transporter ATP-binding protein [Halobacillus karajensis]|uniref:Galactose/methyl galactoside import ATP-binding protein MglA n=1 Tax=Halobacillus karajensis TaxID=195088 RepID=A0A024P9Y9_9BACI|nr:sugar ABC transporter ATP-binding protein [Halobacillus karajensis]CDQ21367.1 Galactose/methyl galactoside import ATP-binding protein MglA [Halobacillus karajensis]CDQ25561.1 Galactose/methyl galactoside import ATP-binding protein MglA [Halobacillus karajensis]CDQ25832.1 Galactose/methyl galactoside import ATP-binding protein MglA [Halobacillus karajensis]